MLQKPGSPTEPLGDEPKKKGFKESEKRRGQRVKDSSEKPNKPNKRYTKKTEKPEKLKKPEKPNKGSQIPHVFEGKSL